MKLLNHVYAIKNLMASGPASVDYKFSDRLISHLLAVIRAKLIEEKANKYHNISEQSYQSLCLTMELSNFHNCCDLPDSDCKVLRSVIKIPKFLNTRWGNVSKVMTPFDGRTLPQTTNTISMLSKYSIVYKDNPSIGWFINDGYLYVINNTYLQTVLLSALFDEPTEIELINCPNSSPNSVCGEYLDQEFPIDSDLVDPMYRLTMEYLLNGYKLPEDTESDFSAKVAR